GLFLVPTSYGLESRKALSSRCRCETCSLARSTFNVTCRSRSSNVGMGMHYLAFFRRFRHCFSRASISALVADMTFLPRRTKSSRDGLTTVLGLCASGFIYRRFLPRRSCGCAALVRTTFRQVFAGQRPVGQALADDGLSRRDEALRVVHVAHV